jgi:hypothetical protein
MRIGATEVKGEGFFFAHIGILMEKANYLITLITQLYVGSLQKSSDSALGFA